MHRIVANSRLWCDLAARHLSQQRSSLAARQGQLGFVRLYVSKAPVSQISSSGAAKSSDEHNGPAKGAAPQAIPLAVPLVVPLDTKAIVNEITKSLESKSKPGKQDDGQVVASITSLPGFSRLIYHYLMLSKIRLTSLVVMTAMAGYAMAPAPFELSTFLLCSIGTTLVSGAANSINQVIETSFDAQMARTRNRVLVQGHLSRLHAVGFALGASTVGVGMLYFGVNELTAALGAANLILYTSIYTPMKRYSILNTWVGSLVGAIPPLMGWAACTGGDIGAGAWILAGLLYCWQFPHFNALSWNIRPEYLKAGYKMMANSHPELCTRVSLRHTGYTTALCLLAPALDVTNMWFALETLPLNAYFAYLAWEFHQKADSKSSRKLFRFSLLHLPLLMILFLLNKKHWVFSDDKPEEQQIDEYLVPNIVAEVGAGSGGGGIKAIEDNLLMNVASVLPAAAAKN
ncbi:protoheme IX farnesyltransferase, mitochondrial [Culex quinquefasciatus]|uniref:Protoheme IX farnesyltransferase, mitochondrial n=1 Tax=Culex quinquefasciatus TaxID=7176 RepID=B0WQ76_CULQU|nr:protoheme IX farnesyltransferase, mitochondrial [Culex quinquefasciatus]|eukprot:XP_001850860.1 protoheme IX farnesyltransferase, mitochondrial [Culex quinquefasciatus]